MSPWETRQTSRTSAVQAGHISAVTTRRTSPAEIRQRFTGRTCHRTATCDPSGFVRGQTAKVKDSA